MKILSFHSQTSYAFEIIFEPLKNIFYKTSAMNWNLCFYGIFRVTGGDAYIVLDVLAAN